MITMPICKSALPCLLLGLLCAGRAGPYVAEEINVQDGMVVGEEAVAVDGVGQITAISQDGYVPNNRYLDDYETGDVTPGPNAPGYIP
jgi:hypothetical protein